MTEQYKNFIGGEWISSHTGKTFKNINPANIDEVVSEHPQSDREDVNNAIKAAKEAFPAWRDISPQIRVNILYKAADLLEKRVDEVATAMTKEMGKVTGETKGETLRSVQLFRWFSGEVLRLSGEFMPSVMNNTVLYSVREPLGVVGLITPWNFPIAIPCWKLAPALASGNTVILKPASTAPISSLKLVEVLAEAGLPAGVLNFVTGPGGVCGDAIIRHPDIKAISFTGSTEIGKRLSAIGGETLTKVQLEMGGKNPIIILEDADLPKAVKSVLDSSMLTTGQKCTACSRAIVEEKIADRFSEMLLEEVKKYKVGDGFDPEVSIGPQIDEHQMNFVLKCIDAGKKEGARLLCGGNRLTDGAMAKGFFVEPTIFDYVKPHMEIAQKEIFGPVLSVIRVQNFEEAIEVANNVGYGLVASIYTRDLAKAHEFIHKIETGMARVNLMTTGVEYQAPFGGHKESGTGSPEQGRVGVDFYTEWKTVNINYK